MAPSGIPDLLALEIAGSARKPKIERELRELIRRMSQENRLWGAPRIHGELLKLGFEIAESTAITGLADLSAQPCGRDRGDRSPPGSDC